MFYGLRLGLLRAALKAWEFTQLTYLLLIGDPLIKQECYGRRVVSISHTAAVNFEPSLPLGGDKEPAIFHGFY